MESRVITVNGFKMKFELKFYGKKPKEGWSLYFPFTGVDKQNPLLMKSNGLDIRIFIK